MTASGEELSRQSFGRSLSLVVQGPLTRQNLEAVAERCEHWRSILPNAVLILSISETDLPAFDGGVRGDVGGASGIGRLRRACDALVVAPAAERLPPVKAGLGFNHVNFQISAARAGLSLVETRHVLRIRNDMTFQDASFIDYYLARRSAPRRDMPLLGARVLISPWFTLNPLTLERLPFHFSDWFHLGDTADVVALWTVPSMTMEDATYYSRQPIQAESGSREAAFHSRLAAEQHLIVHAARRLGEKLVLDRHNDATDIVRSFRMLADDFAIADFAQTPIDFDKYTHLASASDLALVCVDDSDWHAMIGQGAQLDPTTLFAAKIAEARAMLAREAGQRRGGLLRALWRLFRG